MAIEAVLFDIDGTLVDSNDQHVVAWEEAFATVGAGATALYDDVAALLAGFDRSPLAG